METVKNQCPCTEIHKDGHNPNKTLSRQILIRTVVVHFYLNLKKKSLNTLTSYLKSDRVSLIIGDQYPIEYFH